MSDIWKTLSPQTLFTITDEVCPISGETPHEEHLNFLTHAFGLVLGILGMITILWYSYQCGNQLQMIGSFVYGCTMIGVYAASSLYHKCTNLQQKQRLKVADHISIYFFIAGSYTPFTLSPCLGDWGWTIFGLIWGMAVLGSMWKWFFADRWHIVSMVAYLVMGWLIVLAMEPLIANLPATGLTWMVAGGLLYSFGTIFYIWESLPFGHAIWHLCCLGGSGCHYYSIFFYVIPL